MRKSWLVALALSASVGTAIAIAQQKRPQAGTIDLAAILAIEADRASSRSDLQALVGATRGTHATEAIRALGRVQRREAIPDLIALLASDRTRGEAATALVLAFRGPQIEDAAIGQHERAALEALVAASDLEVSQPQPVGLPQISRALGRMPFLDADSFRTAEGALRRVLERPFPQQRDAPHGFAARGLEALQRLNRKLGTLSAETIAELRREARTIDPSRTNIQRNALAALTAAQGVDEETLRIVSKASSPEVRRHAALALAGGGSPIEAEARLPFIRELLSDSSPTVRLEGVRAWMRRGVTTQGCQPLVNATRDESMHVALAAIDALGDLCADEDPITVVIASSATTPPTQGRWQKQAHAFVALAKRDRGRASNSLFSFASHQTWQVRMYAARAAAILEDADMLARLALDPDDNVAETALPTLRRLRGSASDAAFIAALNRRTRAAFNQSKEAPARPYQVIRTAAIALEKSQPTPQLIDALGDALERITDERCETSRDARLALIERLGELGTAEQVPVLLPLLTDIDERVGAAAADVITRWTGKTAVADTPKMLPGNIPGERDLETRVRVSLVMESGARIELMPIASAPLTRQRFLAAVRAGYYNNLTFHRVVPNFVVQGGGPNANEYCGDCPFMRDELGAMHTRGTVGISTRGRDTGDAQIFINLVDNARLDYDYTVFATICSGMEAVDEIQEGDRIIRAEQLPATTGCGG